MADAENDVTDAARVEHLQLVREEGPAGDGHQRLGDLLGDGPKPGGKAAGEDRDGDVERLTHELTSLVPSKSNRKRTSLRPD